MYRYLFEEDCFDRVFEVSKKIGPEIRGEVRVILANILEIKPLEVELVSYEKTEKGMEMKFEARKEINDNFVFRVIVAITGKETILISVKTYISRVNPIYLAGPVVVEDIIYNTMQEFSKKSFYTDVLSEYKLKYEELSKKIYEGLEIFIGFE
ncbi:MAG: hypothetical protein KAU95_04055 [Candidatus Aenigmarchaeota archaeon]|nr:hypothetical protein [Candidatus Aenigmarchaeota archaeon]